VDAQATGEHHPQTPTVYGCVLAEVLSSG